MSMMACDWRTIARASSAGMKPTVRMPGLAVPVDCWATATPATRAARTVNVIAYLSARIVATSCVWGRPAAALGRDARHGTIGSDQPQPLPAHVDVLDLGVAEQLAEALLLAEPALLPAAVRHPDVTAAGVDPHVPGLDALGRLHGLAQIVGHDGRGEAVFHAVGAVDHLVVVLPRHHGHDRAEDLVAADAHGRRDLVEDGGRDEEASRQRGILRPAAAGEELGP